MRIEGKTSFVVGLTLLEQSSAVLVETDWPRGVFLLFNCAPTLPHGSHQLLLAKEKAPNAETVGAKR